MAVRYSKVTVEEAKEIIEKTKTDYRAKNPVPRGLAILVHFSDDVPCRFEHDQMWAGDFEVAVEKMTEVAVEKMTKLGWFEDEEAWSHF